MKKAFQLSIPEPCHEKWSEMSPNEKGRFCGSCQKTVVDFTRMTDEQILKLLKKSGGNTCGHFRSEQLMRPLVKQKKTFPWLRYFITVTIPAFLFFKRGHTQGTPVLTKPDTVSVVDTTRKPVNVKGEIRKDIQNIISGRVMDEEGRGVAYASVMIKGTNKGAATDSTGNFRIPLDYTFKNEVLIITAIGYTAKQIEVKELNPVTVYLIGQEMIFGGLVMISEVEKITEVPPIIPSSNNDLLVFPNPLTAGQPLQMKVSELEEENYQLKIADYQGRTVFTKKMIIDFDATVLEVPLPVLSKGNYLVTLISENAIDKFSGKLIIR